MINPQDIDPETNCPYSNYSSPSLSGDRPSRAAKKFPLPRTKLLNGKLYYFYAGPFKSTMAALDYAKSKICEGDLSQADDAQLWNKAVYIACERSGNSY